jgi:hypothetical protein
VQQSRLPSRSRSHLILDSFLALTSLRLFPISQHSFDYPLSTSDLPHPHILVKTSHIPHIASIPSLATMTQKPETQATENVIDSGESGYDTTSDTSTPPIQSPSAGQYILDKTQRSRWSSGGGSDGDFSQTVLETADSLFDTRALVCPPPQLVDSLRTSIDTNFSQSALETLAQRCDTWTNFTALAVPPHTQSLPMSLVGPINCAQGPPTTPSVSLNPQVASWTTTQSLNVQPESSLLASPPSAQPEPSILALLLNVQAEVRTLASLLGVQADLRRLARLFNVQSESVAPAFPLYHPFRPLLKYESPCDELPYDSLTTPTQPSTDGQSDNRRLEIHNIHTDSFHTFIDMLRRISRSDSLQFQKMSKTNIPH